MEAVSPDCHAAYEQLRILALAKGRSAQGRWGMALFLGRGFGAWMRAWSQARPAHAVERVSSPRVASSEASTGPPGELQAQLVSALAGMVLDALRREAA